MGGAKRERAPRARLRQEEKNRFLEVLGQTGNRSYAAAAIGVEERLMDQRRRFDAAFDRQWEAALDQAHRRLAGADGPLDCIGGAEPMVIRRGRGGRFTMVRAGSRRWSGPVEDDFFAALAACGNIAASARAVGFSSSCIAKRRRQLAGFAQRFEDALEDAELALEFRLAAESGGWDGTERPRAGPAGPDGDPAAAPAAAAFDADLAMRFLKWREDKKHGRGGGRRGRDNKVPPAPPIEEVRESILTRLDAISRHEEAKQLAQGWSRDENGYMIPPGWVRAGAAER